MLSARYFIFGEIDILLKKGEMRMQDNTFILDAKINLEKRPEKGYAYIYIYSRDDLFCMSDKQSNQFFKDTISI